MKISPKVLLPILTLKVLKPYAYLTMPSKAQDSVIAKYAVEKEMQILTQDSDFAQLYHNLYRGKVTVFLIKANPTTAENLIRILEDALPKIKRTEVRNKLLIITKKRIRIIS
jgi:predicted nuclease of predicted toxin-antitoxin system